MFSMVLTYFSPWTLNLYIAIVLLRLRVHYSVEIKRYKSPIRIRIISLLILLLEVRNVKTTCSCRKSWPWNLFQVLDLTPCFKVKWGRHTKTSLFLPIIGAMASECKDRPLKVKAVVERL